MMPARRGRAGPALVAALLLALGTAAASSPAGAEVAKTAPTASRRAPIVFEADEVRADSRLALVIAKGHVEIAQNGYQLLADEVSYNQRTDTVSASGHVSLSLPSGEVMFADFMELRRSMDDEFAKDVRMLLADRSRLAANTARRTGGNYTQLVHGVYSPCDLCPSDPTAPPVWQLKAREIDHDKAQKRVEFRDAVMEIGGWPVFYTPYLSMPDPSVRRQSGFLMPSIGDSNVLGGHVTIPYYWVIGRSEDLTLVPRFTTRAGPELGAEYRQRFSNGMIDAIGSANDSRPGPGVGDSFRGHINARGIFDLNDTYRTGFDLQRVSDNAYLLQFGYGNPFLNTMISRAYLEGFEARAATDANAYLFEPLLPGIGDSTQPIVLPVLNRDWYTSADRFGGRWHFNANFLDILREVGTQTRRISLASYWQRNFLDGIGGTYDFTASLRGDAYSVSDLSRLSNPDLPAAFFPQNGLPPAEPLARDFFAGRAFPQLALQWRYPVIHPVGNWNALVEPIAAAFLAPSSGNESKIPNEDSLAFDFNDTDLFRRDRLPGYDILDTGQRIDYGTKLALYGNSGGSYRLLVGQSYRAEKNPFFPPGSGVEDRFSDLVGGVVLSPSSYLDLIYRFRLDKSTLDNRSQEVAMATGPRNFRLNVNYLLIAPEQRSEAASHPLTGPSVVFGKREQLGMGLSTRLTRYWSLNGSEMLNLTNSSNLVNGVAVPQSSSASLYATLSAIYQDECVAFIGTVTQSGIRNGVVTPGVSVLFSVVFKNLGEVGGTLGSFGGVGIP
jgi:LPS-assembly protein